MSWIQTYSARPFYPLNPRPDDVFVEDIAHSLSFQCRFNGHCRRFYSVAEHSVRVADILPTELRLWGLFHDAAEAYVSDLPRPVKAQLPDYQQAEDVILRVVAEKFGLSWPMPQRVREADDRLLVTEARDLMGPPPQSWGLSAQPLLDKIEPRSAAEAEALFLRRFEELRPR